jgi:endonuclease-3
MNKVPEISKLLRKEYGILETPLSHKNPLQLVIAVILSAQCTDERVNLVTPALFKRFKTVKDFATAHPEELERYIFSTGFYKNKAKNIIACCKNILEKHNGKVPQTMEELVSLAGIGRKTANVVLSQLFSRNEGIVVDTHVGRLAVRLGLVSTKNTKDAVKIERELIKIVPKKEWDQFSLQLIYHGRAICSARKAYCDECILKKFCPSARKITAYTVR